MKSSVITFPGSNCDRDMDVALKKFGFKNKMVWHDDAELPKSDLIVLPGGFSYGDYLRCGSMASKSKIMKSVINFANSGGMVMGICNGFQILCESGLLPGALVRNDCIDFRCINQPLLVENSNQIFNQANLGESLTLPIAHGEGNYRADESTLASLEENGQVLFRYSGNPNGSINDIAGIRNKAGNVYGMMPHPERAVSPHHPCLDGLPVLEAFFGFLLSDRPVEIKSS